MISHANHPRREKGSPPLRILATVHFMPPTAEKLEAFPINVSLILIEEQLPVDNALPIAAMASHLPNHQLKIALRPGIIGACRLRGISLAFVSWIQSNYRVKSVEAGYLICLMYSIDNVFAALFHPITSQWRKIRPVSA